MRSSLLTSALTASMPVLLLRSSSWRWITSATLVRSSKRGNSAHMHRVSEEPQAEQRCFILLKPFNDKFPRQLYNVPNGTIPSAKVCFWILGTELGSGHPRFHSFKQ